MFLLMGMHLIVRIELNICFFAFRVTNLTKRESQSLAIIKIRTQLSWYV